MFKTCSRKCSSFFHSATSIARDIALPAKYLDKCSKNVVQVGSWIGWGVVWGGSWLLNKCAPQILAKFPDTTMSSNLVGRLYRTSLKWINSPIAPVASVARSVYCSIRSCYFPRHEALWNVVPCKQLTQQKLVDLINQTVLQYLEDKASSMLKNPQTSHNITIETALPQATKTLEETGLLPRESEFYKNTTITWTAFCKAIARDLTKNALNAAIIYLPYYFADPSSDSYISSSFFTSTALSLTSVALSLSFVSWFYFNREKNQKAYSQKFAPLSDRQLEPIQADITELSKQIHHIFKQGNALNDPEKLAEGLYTEVLSTIKAEESQRNPSLKKPKPPEAVEDQASRAPNSVPVPRLSAIKLVKRKPSSATSTTPNRRPQPPVSGENIEQATQDLIVALEAKVINGTASATDMQMLTRLINSQDKPTAEFQEPPARSRSRAGSTTSNTFIAMTAEEEERAASENGDEEMTEVLSTDVLADARRALTQAPPRATSKREEPQASVQKRRRASSFSSAKGVTFK